MLSRILILVAFLVILGVPLGVKLTQKEIAPPANARRLVIVTPHVPQIRREFGEAFAAWHQREFGEPAFVDWRSPGAGTTEILKILGAQYTAAAKEGKATNTMTDSAKVARAKLELMRPDGRSAVDFRPPV